MKPKEMTAGQITAYALKVLDLQNMEVWRSNNLPVRGRAFIGRKGVADIMGFCRHSGRLVACEVKKIGDTLKPAQIEFLSQVKSSGAVALIATQRGGEVVIEEY
jgi:hypothetical protein